MTEFNAVEMASLKLDVRSSAQGRPDLVTFLVKGDSMPDGVPASEFDGSPLSHVLLRDGDRRTLVIGLGEKAKLEPDSFRRAAGAAIKHFLKLGAADLALDLAAWPAQAGPAVEGALLASYKFEGFGRDNGKPSRPSLSRLQVLVRENEVTAARMAAQEAEKIVTAVNT